MSYLHQGSADGLAHCFLEWEVFNRVRSVSLRAWATSLNKRSGLPHRNTCIKILGIIRTLVQVKLQGVVAHVVWEANFERLAQQLGRLLVVG